MLSSTTSNGFSRVHCPYHSSSLGGSGVIWNLACLVTFLLTNGTVIPLYSSINVAIPTNIGSTYLSCVLLLAEALEFGVCTHLELLNVSVQLCLNKDSSDGMNSRNKDVSDSFFLGSQNDGN